jgi:hypothetical protein
VQALFRQTQDMLEFIFMTPVEVELMKAFGYESKIPMTDLKDIIVDTNLQESLYPFAYLFNTFRPKLGMDQKMFNSMSQTQLGLAGTPFADSLLLARNLNDNLFNLYFSSQNWIDCATQNKYVDISKYALGKLSEFKTSLQSQDGSKFATSFLRIRNGEVQTLQDAKTINIGTNAVHPQSIVDIEVFQRDFGVNTNGLFNEKKRCSGDRN